MLVIFLILLILIGLWSLEYIGHQRILKKIPIRVHVNGTRGKSSVTRLIAAGLRAGGLKTLAKTTGTLPRVIDEHGLEIKIHRPKMVNIIEQLGIVKFVSRRNADALVIECMAVHPEFQWICEHKIVKATVGVITNARMDHVREMGPSLENITKSLCNTIPTKGIAFTSARRTFPIMEKEAKKLGAKIIQVDSETVTDAEMAGFSYVEHKGNVSLSLAVCQHLGVDRQTALEGMYRTHPDVGAMKILKVREGNKDVYFVNALAANDPDSTLEIWRNLDPIFVHRKRFVILLNSRSDRFDRSIQLLEMMQSGKMDFSELLLTGQKCEQVMQNAVRLKLPKDKITVFGIQSPEDTYKHIIDNAADNGLTIVYAIGNMGMGGLQVGEHFKRISLEQAEAHRSRQRIGVNLNRASA